MKLKFTKAWISFLRLPLPLDVYKEVTQFTFTTNHFSWISHGRSLPTCYLLLTRFLLVFTRQSFPIYLILQCYGGYSIFTKAFIFLYLSLSSISAYVGFTILCSDFLTKSYDIGGVVSVMALSSLFILMTQHGLEYPNFYDKLYVLLVPSVFVAKHRAKFLQVLR